jgi:hypothetical protein
MELQSKQLSTKGPAGMFGGDVYFDVIAKGEEPSRMRVNTVRFAPSARTASHAHAVGQRRSTSPRASGWSSPAAVSRGRVPPRTRGTSLDKSGRVYVVGSVPGLHPEIQTVDEMLEDWRNQQLCRNLDHDAIAGRCLMSSLRSGDATTDQQRTRLPM